MQTKLIEGVTPLPNHYEIQAAIEAEGDFWGAGGTSKNLAVLNARGEIFLIALTVGMGEFVGAVGTLKHRFGLIDSEEGPHLEGFTFSAFFRAAD